MGELKILTVMVVSRQIKPASNTSKNTISPPAVLGAVVNAEEELTKDCCAQQRVPSVILPDRSEIMYRVNGQMLRRSVCFFL